jgi:lipopolysaccharide exporter
MKNLKQKFSSSLRWSLLEVFISKGLSIIYVVFITRLLNPEDFGLYSVAMATITMVLMFSITSVDVAIVQKKETNDDYLNAAWTIELIKHLFIGGLIYTIAPSIEKIININGVGEIMRVISFAIPLMGFKNIGIILFRKELELKKLFWYNIIPQLISMVITIFLAIQLKNVWAIVYGYIIQTFLLFIFSYFFHPYRPHIYFNISIYRKLLNFGKWLLLNGILQSGIKQGIVMMIGRSFGATSLGYFNRSMAFSINMFNPLQKLFAKLIFPTFSHLHNNNLNITTEFCKTLKYSSFLIGTIISTGFMFADEFVFFLLGNKWISIIPLLKILYINTFFQLIIIPFNMLYISIGKLKVRTIYTSINLLILVIFFIPFANLGNLQGIAILILISNFIMFFSISWNTAKYINIKFIDILNSIKYGIFISTLIITESYLLIQFYPNPSLSVLVVKMIILIITIFISLILFERKKGLQLNYLMNMLLPKSRIIGIYENIFCRSTRKRE